MSEFEAFSERLRARLGHPLPGFAAQLAMAPSHRAGFKPPSGASIRKGAVMILVFPASDGISTLFTVRRDDLADHAGQISFPGGKREDGETFEEAALRECEEEIRLERSGVKVLGKLSTLFIPPTRFVVHPFVGAVPELPPIIPQEREVASVLRVPLRTLADPATHREEDWTIGGAPSRVPFFHVDGHTIWGATAMITAELLELLVDIDAD